MKTKELMIIIKDSETSARNLDLTGTDLADQDLRNIDFTGSALSKTKFHRARLSNAIMKNKDSAWKFLALDVVIGFIAFINHHFLHI